MNYEKFKTLMVKVKLLEGDYVSGYQYGLRRHYHGEQFGENRIIEGMKNRQGALAQGVLDGLQGKEPRLYCTQNNLNCPVCSLTNYEKDCKNNPL